MSDTRSLEHAIRDLLEATSTAQAKSVGTDSKFRSTYNKGSSSHALKVGAARNTSQELAAAKQAEDSQKKKETEIEQRKKDEEKRKADSPIKEEEDVIEAKEASGTIERRKIENVGRPTTAPTPFSSKSKLSKQAEIKTKIIDEEEVMNSEKNFGLPKSLIAAAQSVMEKKDVKDTDDKKITGGKTPVVMNPKTDDKLATEEVEQVDEISRGLASRYIDKTKDSSSRKAGRALALKKKWGDKNYGTSEPRVKATEEVDQVDEVSKSTLTSYVKKVAALPPEKVKSSRDKGIEMASKKLHKEEVALSDEETARIVAKMNEAHDDDKDPEEYDPSTDKSPEHIVMQLRKTVSLRGAKPVEFNNGEKHHIEPKHAAHALQMHNNMKKASDKEEYAKQLAHSHASFKAATGT